MVKDTVIFALTSSVELANEIARPQNGNVAPLVLNQHNQSGNDIKRRHQNYQRQNNEHHVMEWTLIF